MRFIFSERSASATTTPKRRPSRPWRAFPAAALLLLFVFTLPGSSLADEVILRNGDRITGVAVKLDGGKLTLQTPHAKDPIDIDWSSVKSFRQEKPCELHLKDGARVKGTLETTEDGVLRIVTGSTEPIRLKGFAEIAQINVPPAPPVKYNGDVAAALSLASGNSDTTTATATGKFVARSARQRLTLLTSWKYSEDRGALSAKEGGGSIKYDFFISKKLYTWLNTRLEHNKFQDMNLRTTVGGGLGYQFFEDPLADLNFELGAAFFNEDYIAAEDKRYAAGRWSVNLEVRVIPGKVVLFHFHEGYLGFEEADDLFLSTQQGVRLTVVDNLFASFQANVSYDRSPAPGIKTTDTTALFGLGYNFDL